MFRSLLGDWSTYRNKLAQWQQRNDAGRDLDFMGLGEDDAPSPPALRDYDYLLASWTRLMELSEQKGRFKDNDRLNDELHQASPERVISVMRKDAEKKPELLVGMHAAEKAREAERAAEQVASTSNPTVSLVPSETGEDDCEEEEAARGDKRRRTTTKTFQALPSSFGPSQGGRVSKRKGRGWSCTVNWLSE